MVEIKSFTGSSFSSNVFLVRGEETFIVDAGIGITNNVKAYLEKEGLTLHRIILTHRHYDHTADAKRMSELIGSPLYASEPEALALRQADDHTIFSTAFGQKMPKLDVKTLKEDHYAGFNIIATPGHTIGSISLYHPEEKILISGDTVFPHGGVGRTDLPTGNINSLKESVEILSRLDVVSLYPGHGPIIEENAGRHVDMSLRFIDHY